METAVPNRLRRLAMFVCSLALVWLCAGCAATSVLTFAYEQSPEGQGKCLSAGCAASHSQSTNPSPVSGLAVK